jgi:hypothetical protein
MYNIRQWLNPETSSSSGSIVACHEPEAFYRNGEPFDSLFLEISDCHQKIRLHKAYKDSRLDFYKKLKVLHKVIGDFIIYLEKTNI